MKDLLFLDKSLLVKVFPYPQHAASKKVQIAEMFDNISQRYDFLNRLLSMRVDVLWRRRAITCLRTRMENTQAAQILDIATGTADFALEAATQMPQAQIQGIDISKKMLEVGQKKVAARQLSERIQLQEADAESLPFASDMFHAAIIAFGVRNFEHPQASLSEIFRVLRPRGILLVLEFSHPQHALLRPLFSFYFRHILPRIGSFFSGDGSAYAYLPSSVAQFPSGPAFADMLAKAKYNAIHVQPLTFGICSVYVAYK